MDGSRSMLTLQNAIERIKHYTELGSEAASSRDNDPSAEQWPSQGAINFTNVQLRYRSELPLILKGVSFDIRAGEKVGVIGRTGAGKSSLIAAIYRTVELAGGSIAVDGVDLSGLGLHTVRAHRHSRQSGPADGNSCAVGWQSSPKSLSCSKAPSGGSSTLPLMQPVATPPVLDCSVNV